MQSLLVSLKSSAGQRDSAKPPNLRLLADGAVRFASVSAAEP